MAKTKESKTRLSDNTIDDVLELIYKIRAYKGGEPIPVKITVKDNVLEGKLYKRKKEA